VWVKFSLTKNNLEVQYKHVPLHPTFEETAPPRPRPGTRRRKLWEIFHPERLAPKPRPKKVKPPKPRKQPRPPKTLGEPKEKPTRKRKSNDDAGEPQSKRRAIRAVAEVEHTSNPQSVPDRDSSLQPLFDFLGSAGRIGEIGTEVIDVDVSDRHTESAPPAPEDESGAMMMPDETARGMRVNMQRNLPYPGMMSGRMNKNQITWIGSKGDDQITLFGSTETRGPQQAGTQVAHPSDAGHNVNVSATPPTAERTGLTPATEAVSEVESLKRRLMEAEAKIQSLEAQKQNSGIPPFRPPQHYYPPPQAPYPPPPTSQWHYPPPVPSGHPHHAPNYPPHAGRAPAQQPSALPQPAPPATHPYAYQQTRQYYPPHPARPSHSYQQTGRHAHLAPAPASTYTQSPQAPATNPGLATQPRSGPSYGFVSTPGELTTRPGAHVHTPSQQSVPLRNQDHLAPAPSTPAGSTTAKSLAPHQRASNSPQVPSSHAAQPTPAHFQPHINQSEAGLANSLAPNRPRSPQQAETARTDDTEQAEKASVAAAQQAVPSAEVTAASPKSADQAGSSDAVSSVPVQTGTSS
jgi:hypothetical protein